MSPTPRVPFEIIDKIILNIPDAAKAFKIAVALRRIFVRDSLIPKLRSDPILHASYNGLVGLLDWWWLKSGLRLTYSKHAMNFASARGHVAVLQWWKDSGLELKYDNSALDFASQNGHIAVLDWWKQSGLPLEYSNHSMQHSLLTTRGCIRYYSDNETTEDVAVIDWWTHSYGPVPFPNYVRSSALPHPHRHVEILQWWKDSGLPLKYEDSAVDIAWRLGRVEVLQWWKDSGLLVVQSLENTIDPMDYRLYT